MDFDSKDFGSIGNKWKYFQSKGEATLLWGENKISIKIKNDEIWVSLNGSGRIAIIREGTIAFLEDGSRGKIKKNDQIWLINGEDIATFESGERNNFIDRVVVLDIVEKKKLIKNIIVREKRYFDQKGNRQLNIVLSLGVLTFLVGSTIMGYQKRMEKQEYNNLEKIKNEINQKIEESSKFNNNDIQKSLDILLEAKKISQKSSFKNNDYQKELEELNTKIDEGLKKRGGNDFEFEVAYDTNLIYEGEKQFNGMAMKDNIAYLYSKEKREIYSSDISLQSKEKIVEDQNIANFSGIFNSGERWYGFGGDNIWEIKREGLREINSNINLEAVDGWGGVIYGLNNENRQIVKVLGSENRNWLVANNPLPEKMVSMAIDGDIWTLGESGKIYIFSRGISKNYEASFIENTDNPKLLLTNEKINFLAYVNGNKVLVYGKDGKILSRFNFEDKKIIDIAIENSKQAILVLCENGKIYRINNHEIF